MLYIWPGKLGICSMSSKHHIVSILLGTHGDGQVDDLVSPGRQVKYYVEYVTHYDNTWLGEKELSDRLLRKGDS